MKVPFICQESKILFMLIEFKVVFFFSVMILVLFKSYLEQLKLFGMDSIIL